MIVLDASATVEVLLRTRAGDLIASRIRAAKAIQAPHLLDLEVAQVIRRYAASGALTIQRANQALWDFRALRILRYPHTMLLGRIWELRHNFTAYDAAYLALAEALGAILLTRDASLASGRGHRAKVELA